VKKGWVGITQDHALRFREHELHALTEAASAVFILRNASLNQEQQSATIRLALPRMRTALRRFGLPLVASISRDGRVTVFVAAGK
jgi:hypothetical protein